MSQHLTLQDINLPKVHAPALLLRHVVRTVANVWHETLLDGSSLFGVFENVPVALLLHDVCVAASIPPKDIGDLLGPGVCQAIQHWLASPDSSCIQASRHLCFLARDLENSKDRVMN